MSWESFWQNVTWYNGPDPGGNAGPLSQDGKDEIRDHLQALYSGSPLAAAAMDAVVPNGPLIIAASIGTLPAFSSIPSNLVAYDLARISDIYFINNEGELVQENLHIAIIHEILHLSKGIGEDLTGYTDTILNGENFDQRGSILFDASGTDQGDIATQMNIAHHQVSYTAAIESSDPRYGQLQATRAMLGHDSYTDGNEIDVARFGDISNPQIPTDNNIDHTQNTTNLRDLIFGFGGADTIRSGDGDDYVYGGSGNDTLIDGGNGNDVLYGENGDDLSILGGDGDDFLDGGAGTNTLDGGADSDAVSFRSLASGITVTYANGVLSENSADNTISNIESVITTEHVDTLTLNGAPGLIATLGGADIINIEPTEPGGPQIFLLAPGEQGDSIRFSHAPWASQPGVILLSPDTDDRLLFNEFNIIDFVGQAQYSNISPGRSLWYNLGGGPEDNITRALEVTDQGDGGVSISYWINVWSGPNYTTYGMGVYVYGFESGDFGLTFAAPPANGSTIRSAIADLATEYELSNVLAAIQSDHVWNWIGVGSWQQAGGATSGADTYAGVASSDVADGLGGDDTLNGGGGDDLLNGGPGADTLNGGGDDDVLSGDGDADTLSGGAGVDTLDGGLGNDTLDGGDGNDVLRGSFGNDAMAGGLGDITITSTPAM